MPEITPERLARLCDRLGIEPLGWRGTYPGQSKSAWIPNKFGNVPPEGFRPGYPPLDEWLAVRMMEAARSREAVIIRAWPCHDRRQELEPGLPSGGWWARWLPQDQIHAATLPDAVALALEAALGLEEDHA